MSFYPGGKQGQGLAELTVTYRQRRWAERIRSAIQVMSRNSCRVCGSRFLVKGNGGTVFHRDLNSLQSRQGKVAFVCRVGDKRIVRGTAKQHGEQQHNT